MTRVRMVLAYDGSPYQGFAIQDEGPTVAGDLTEILEKILGHEIKIVCAGRTDTGVHAQTQVIHFDTDKSAEELATFSSHDGLTRFMGQKSKRFDCAPLLPGITRSLNKLLAPNIVVRETTEAPEDFHARYSAKSRTYRYKILNKPLPDPFLARTSWHIDYPLEVAAMRLATDAIIGQHDFAAFSKPSESPNATTTRVVYEANWDTTPSGIVGLEITAQAFCRQMIRSLVGTMVEMGLGRMKAGEMSTILRSKDRQLAGVVAPPHGLCLWNVEY